MSFMTMKHFKNQLLLAFLFFSTTLGVLFYIAIDYSIHQTEDYVLKDYLQGAVDHSLAKPLPELPNQYAISSRLVTKAELPVDLNGQTPVIYQTGAGGEHTFNYIRPWPLNDQYLIATIDEAAASDFEEKESYIQGFMMVVVIIIVLLSWLLALGLAHIMARPLLQLTQVINQTSVNTQTDLPQALYGADRKDEIGHLSRAFSTLLQRVRSALDQERAFSHHVSHELRTPLALISNATALLKQQPTCEAVRIANNVQRIEKAAERIDARIRLFLHLGLEEQPKETVHLKEVWQNTVSYIRQQVAEPIPFQQQQIAEVSVKATPSLVQALFENSLLNAVQYGEAIEVELNEQHYCICNTIPDAASDQGNRFGYGLAIIQRVCEASGWQLEVKQTAKLFRLVVVFD